MTTEFKLKAMGNVRVKSLYGRARVRDYGNGVLGLLSYGTLIAAGTKATANTPATLYRIYDYDFEENYGGWSATSATHLESFATFLGATYGNKKAWTAKPYTTLEEVFKACTAVAA